MSKVIKIKVVGPDGAGLAGQKVQALGASQVLTTDAGGMVGFLIAEAETVVTINDKQAFSGPIADLKDIETFTAEGVRK